MTTDKREQAALALTALDEGLLELEEPALHAHFETITDHLIETEEALDEACAQVNDLRGRLARAHELVQTVAELLHFRGDLPVSADLVFRLKLAYSHAELIMPKVLLLDKAPDKPGGT